MAASDNGLGLLFRTFGEAYIKSYRPSLVEIKLIRSIRVCKTPALGGRIYTCKKCSAKTYIYHGCGNSRCPKCQGIKRLQWQDKIANKILQCPYQHIVFTMPHQLNTLARNNPYKMYNCLLRSAWITLKTGSADKSNLGALPGAIMVLHTFGSDLKYHVHVHALVTFGGVDSKGQWQWPKRKKKIIPFRQFRNKFRNNFVKHLEKIYPELQTRIPFAQLKTDLYRKSWCVHAEPPTMRTKVIQEYLGRYICRIGVSKNKLKYDPDTQQVTLSFKDYRKAEKGNPKVPISQKKLKPLVAIDQIMRHCLPSYFQKCRYCGLHASATLKKYHHKLPAKIKNNGQTVRTIFQIIKALLGVEEVACEHCQSTHFDIDTISPDNQYIRHWIQMPPNIRGSPANTKHGKLFSHLYRSQHGIPMPIAQGNQP